MTVSSRPRATPDQRIRAALWFADHGFGVFSVWSARADGTCRCPLGAACSSPGKHPITPHGFEDSTRDPARIRLLLSAGSEPNYGLVCPDGVFALDVDGDGVEQLARLETRYGPLPDTLRTRTAHGEHVFLRWPDGLPRPLKRIFGFVTRWGSGRQAGYVIGPRSIHPSGAEYTPAGVLEIAELPRPWVDAILAGEEAPVITVGGDRLPEVGSRHDWLRDRARYLRGVLDDRDAVRAALLAFNAKFPQPKTPAEVDRAIGEVFERFPADPPEQAEERVSRRLGDDELGILSASASGDFPPPPEAVAFAGLLGELTEDLAAGTDASTIGLLGSLVAFCGALLPGQAYFARMQTSSPYVALVGESSIGRKGTAMARVMDAMSHALESTPVNRVILDGVNSGEGLISALHYKKEHFPHEPTVGLLFEEEYATLLAARGRDGSTLDPKMRQAFDGGPLSNRRSSETKTVLPPYWLPALIGITPAELRERLEPAALQSGSANRWIYLPVVRREIVALNTAPAFADEHRAAIVEAHRATLKRTPILDVDPGVTRLLAEYADFLPRHSVGVARDLTRRLQIIAFRIALVHALVERSSTVTVGYVHRALALTEYARRGIGWIFGDTIGNPDADLLFRHLVAVGRLTKSAITREIIRDPIRRQKAIDELLRLGRAEVVTIQTGGRGRTELVATPNAGAFFPFFQGSAMRNPKHAPDVERMEKSPPSRTNGLEESLEESRKELEETRLVDHSTGETTEASHIDCDDPRGHYKDHRNTPTGWVCTVCEGN